MNRKRNKLMNEKGEALMCAWEKAGAALVAFQKRCRHVTTDDEAMAGMLHKTCRRCGHMRSFPLPRSESIWE